MFGIGVAAEGIPVPLLLENHCNAFPELAVALNGLEVALTQ